MSNDLSNAMSQAHRILQTLQLIQVLNLANDHQTENFIPNCFDYLVMYCY
jgi:hypothetical protein